MKSTILIEKNRYNVEVWIMEPISGIYRFGLQVLGSNTIAPYVIRLSEEFIEDEIDNSKNKVYLEKVAMKVAEEHLEEMMSLTPHAVISNLAVWFKSAKQKVDEESDVLVKA